jgi:type II restriction/modification system DNA methylase subunit YeeA
MDTTLKNFAQNARRQLREQVAARMEQVLQTDSVEIREQAQAIKELQAQINQSTKDAVIDMAAYTWFNRFCALRFMDVRNYTRVRAVSPQEGFTQPEILQEAKQGIIDESLPVERQRVFDLLNGRLPSRDPQGEAYRLLLVGVCNAYYEAMPFLFEEIADYTELLMPEDLLSENSVLHTARQALTPDTCEDVEVIGWLYQYYISEKKAEVLEGIQKNMKVKPDDLPAATQLFTPEWIVQYLVENSLGRLWMLNHPNSRLVEQMEYYIQPEEPENDFLQVESPEELKICDPACGSGHMMTYAFDLLYSIYEEQGYDPVQIPQLILQMNLYGIEIDQRAGHLAAFALTMKARERDRRFFRRGVEPNICVLRNVSFSASELDDYKKAVGSDFFTIPLWETLKQFEDIQTYGSLIRPKIRNPEHLEKLFVEKSVGMDLFLHATHKKVLDVLQMTAFLNEKYHVIVANPPYLGGKGMSNQIKDFAKDNYPESKSDLFAMFIERVQELGEHRSQLGLVTPSVWMFLSSYEKLRSRIITNTTIITLVQLEYNAFAPAVIPVCVYVFENQKNPEFVGSYIRLTDFKGSENQAPKTLEAIRNLNCGWFFRTKTAGFKKIPGVPIAYWIKGKELFEGNTIESRSFSGGRNKTHGNSKYMRFFWEVVADKNTWKPYLNGGGFRKYYGNELFVVNWSQNAKDFYESKGGLLPEKYWNRKGLCWSLITSATNSFRIKRSKFIFSSGTPTILNPEFDYDYSLLGFLNSNISKYYLKAINPTLNTTVGDVLSLPFVLPKQSETINEIVEECINISKSDWDSSELSSDFVALPLLNPEYLMNSLEETYTTLRCRWVNSTTAMQKLEEKNNRIFINAYGLQEELITDVPMREITLTCNPYYRYSSKKNTEELEALLLADTMKEFISYAVGCMFGRYSLDKPGLILANQGETLRDYLKQVSEPTFPADDDNVIPVLDEGWFDDDIVERFKRFLRVTFGDEHYEENLAFLETAIGKDIRSYFLRDFYKEHVKMYKKRPIYWLFSSPKGSFNALIYMHRYRPDTVSIILNDYLREYREKITSQKSHLQAVERNPNASQGEKTKALREIDKINKILAELREYEDEILYPLATQQIDIDLDDGVKANYPKFGKALKKVSGLS